MYKQYVYRSCIFKFFISKISAFCSMSWLLFMIVCLACSDWLIQIQLAIPLANPCQQCWLLSTWHRTTGSTKYFSKIVLKTVHSSAFFFLQICNEHWKEVQQCWEFIRRGKKLAHSDYLISIQKSWKNPSLIFVSQLCFIMIGLWIICMNLYLSVESEI
jgi:hypothetical protein